MGFNFHQKKKSFTPGFSFASQDGHKEKHLASQARRTTGKGQCFRMGGKGRPSGVCAGGQTAWASRSRIYSRKEFFNFSSLLVLAGLVWLAYRLAGRKESCPEKQGEEGFVQTDVSR